MWNSFTPRFFYMFFIGLYGIYSAIHKAAGSLVTGHSQKTASQNTP